MTVHLIDVQDGEAVLSLSRHEITTVRRALQKMANEITTLTDDDKWFLLELNGVGDLLKDGNFTRFLSYHRELLKSETQEAGQFPFLKEAEQ